MCHEQPKTGNARVRRVCVRTTVRVRMSSPCVQGALPARLQGLSSRLQALKAGFHTVVGLPAEEDRPDDVPDDSAHPEREIARALLREVERRVISVGIISYLGLEFFRVRMRSKRTRSSPPTQLTSASQLTCSVPFCDASLFYHSLRCAAVLGVLDRHCGPVSPRASPARHLC